MKQCKQYRFMAIRRVLSAALALVLAFSLLPVQADAPVGNYVSPGSASVNYYSYNGSSLSSLGLLNINSAYLVTGTETINGVTYYIITVSGTSCYVKSSNVSVTATDAIVDAPAAVPATPVETNTSSAGSNDPIGTLVITPAGTTNMRSSAHMLSGNIVAKIPQNTVLSIYGTVVPPSGNHVWYYCFDPASGQYGYIVDDCVRVQSLVSGAVVAELPDRSPLAGAPTADPALAGSTVIGYIRITPSGKTNIRKTAKTDVKNVVAQAQQNDILPYYAVSVVNGDTWYYVYYQPTASFGYVLGSCAQVTDNTNATTIATAIPGATAAPVNFTNSVQGYIRFTAGGVNLRKSASSGAKVVGRFDKDEVTPYYGVTNSDNHTWYQVSKDGVTGYVMGDFCVVVSNTNSATASPGATAAPATVLGYLMTTTDKVYVRKKASTSAGVYGQVKTAGTVLPIAGPAVTGAGVTWYPVTFEGNIGYIHGSYVSVLNNDQAAAYQNGQPLPTATPAPTAAPKAVDYIQTTTDKVWIRSAPSTAASTKGQALLGAVFHFTGMTTGGGVQWYKIEYAGATCYIMAKFCRVMNDAEYAAYAGSVTPVNGGAATATPVDNSGMSNTAITTMAKVIVRAEGRSGGKQVGLLYREGAVCTLLGATNIANNYTWYNVSVNGITGWIRGDLLRILTKAEAENYAATGSTGGSTSTGTLRSMTGGSSIKVTLYKPELIDWNTGGIQTIFAKGDTAIVTDVRTGISFQVRRWSGGDHADVEPLTSADTAAMCKIYGVSKAQDISDKNLYQRHPILVTLKGHSYAASMYGVPHNYPAGDTIANNNFNGQFCIHFVNSRVHKSDKVDKDHQAAIMYAYEHAAELLGIN